MSTDTGTTGRLVPTAEHEMLRDVVAGFTARHVTSEARRTAIEQQGELDASTWAALTRQVGATALLVPEDDGGQGYGWREGALVLEELAGALTSGPILSSLLSSRALASAAEGTPARARLARLADGKEPVGWCLPLGSDPLDTTVELAGGRVHGEATALEVVDGPQLVAARDAEGALALVVVPQGEDVDVDVRDSLDLTRPQATVRFDGAVPEVVATRAEELLGHLRNESLVAIAAEQVGVARAALAMAREHALSRHQFGRPIGSFQAVKHTLADMFVLVEGASAALADAVWAADAEPVRLHPAATVAASYAGDACLHVTCESIHVHGGMGFTWEHDAHLYYRRALSLNGLFGHPRDHDAALGDALVTSG